MRIVFITTTSINGGAQKHMRDMFLELSKKDNQMYLIAPKGWLVDELKDYENNIFLIDGKLSENKKVAQMLDEIKPDVINTFLLSGGMLGYTAWKRKKEGKIFITVNNPVIYDGIKLPNKILYPMFYRYMAKGANAFLVKSDKVREEVELTIRHKKPVLSIKNGIDFRVYDKEIDGAKLRESLGVPKDSVLITTTGALEERKGQRYLIDAVVSLKKEYDKLFCWIAGGGSLLEELQKYISEKSANDYIKLIGNRKDIPEVLAATDIYVLPSLHEGLPNSLMEAMAMGLACVATDVGGVRELIIDDGMGIVINAKNSDEIEEALKKLLGNGSLADGMADKAYERIRSTYSIDVVSDELEKIYIGY